MAAALLIGCSAFCATLAGGLSIQPVRVYLDARQTTQSIEVHNSGDQLLSLQIRAYDWDQDGQGRDQYTTTDELTFFPRMLTLDPGERRIVRLGVHGVTPDWHLSDEHSYRIYLEELPDPAAAPAGDVRTLLRVGVPVFFSPQEQQLGGEVVNLDLQNCEASFDVANRGNTHLLLQTVVLHALDQAGLELEAANLKGWYVLAGREKPHSLRLTEEICKQTRGLRVEVLSNQGSFEAVADKIF